MAARSWVSSHLLRPAGTAGLNSSQAREEKTSTGLLLSQSEPGETLGKGVRGFIG